MNSVKKIMVILISVCAAVLFCACGSQKAENVLYSTSLTVSSGFSGTRTVTITYPPSVIDPRSKTAEDFEASIRKNCPSSITYVKGNYSDKTEYTFSLAFTSFSDYKAKIADLLGNEPTLTFSNPNTPLAKGWRINEDFQSCQLFDWIANAAKADGVSLPDYQSEEPQTKVVWGNTPVSTGPVINVNKLSGYPIEKINIVTVNRTTATQSLFDRTINFTIKQKTFDALGDKLKQYFTSVTEKTAKSDWFLENNHYIYTVNFEGITQKQLEGYTNRLFSSVYGDISYVDKTVGSTALAYQNSFTETLDFSNYIGPDNEDVPVEYTYSLTNNSKLDECRIYTDMKWISAPDLLDTNNPGKIAAIKNQSPSITLRINDGKQYVPRSIDIIVTPLDNNNIRKSIAFVYDIAQNGYEASDYTASYFAPLGMIASKTVEDGCSVCTVTVNGSAAEINAKLNDIFGDKNLIDSSSTVPFMTLRTRKSLQDTVDLSALLVSDNLDTPVHYIVTPADGEMVESLSLQYADSTEIIAAEPDAENRWSLTLSNTTARLDFVVSAPNIADIIIFSIISLVLILTAVGLIFFLRSRKLPVPALDDEPPKPVLDNKKGSKHQMILRKKKEIKGESDE